MVDPSAEITTYLLVTGARALPVSPDDIAAELEAAVREHGLATLKSVVVIHGACPHQRGSKSVSVDAVAERWAWGRGWVTKRFPAEYDQHGRAAGPIRNSEMVRFVVAQIAAGHRGMCIGLPDVDYGVKEGSGTWDTLTKARRAGINTDARRRFMVQAQGWTGRLF